MPFDPFNFVQGRPEFYRTGDWLRALRLSIVYAERTEGESKCGDGRTLRYLTSLRSFKTHTGKTSLFPDPLLRSIPALTYQQI